MADRGSEYNALKKAFEAGNKKAPENLWDSISGKMDAESSKDILSQKIAESFELRHQKAAPGFVWEGVNRQLNIDSTWNSLRHVLDGYTMRRRVVRYAAVVLLLISLSIASAEYFGVFDTSNESKNKGLASREPQNELQKIAEPTVIEPQQKSSQTVTTAEENNIREKSSQTIVLAMALETANIIDAEKLTSAGNVSPVTVEEVSISAASIAQFPVTHDPVEEDKKVHKLSGRFSAGLIYGINKTTLLNNETRLSNNERSLISSGAAFVSSYGVTGRYAITPTGTVHGSFFMGDRVKQVYHTYMEGIYTEKQIVLDYRKLSLSYQQNIYTIPGSSITTYVRGGLYQAWLTRASVSLNSVKKITTEYAAHDNGITLQLGQQAGKGRLKVGYGLNFEKGRQNIFTGKGNVPADFNVTSTMRMGAFTEVFYTF